MRRPQVDPQERQIITAARHTLRRPEAREREWLSLLDELEGQEARIRFARECARMAWLGFVRAFLLRAARGGLALLLLGLVRTAPLLVTEWSALLGVGLVLLMLAPCLQRRAFDPAWYRVQLPTWIWRASAFVWGLLLLSALFISRDYGFAVCFAAMMTLLYGSDVGRLRGPRTAREG